MLVVMRRSPRFTGLEFNNHVTVGAGFAVNSDSSIIEPDSVRRILGCLANLGGVPCCKSCYWGYFEATSIELLLG